MLKKLLSGLILCTFSLVHGQTDTLEVYLKKLNDQAEQLYRSDLGKSKHLCLEILERGESNQKSKEIAKAFLTLGDCYYKENKIDSSFFCYKEGLTLFEALKDGVGFTNANQKLGNHFNRGKDYTKALYHYQKVIDYRKSINDEKGLASIYNNMVVLMEAMGNIDLAGFYLGASYHIRKKLGDPRELALSLNRMGNFHIKQGDFIKAESSFEELLTLIKPEDDKRNFVNTLNSLSTTKMELGKYKEAETHLASAKIKAEELKDGNLMAVVNFNKGANAYYYGKYKEASDYNLSAIKYLESNKTTVNIELLNQCYFNQFITNAALGRKEAEEWYQKYLLSNPNNRNLANLYLNNAKYYAKIGNSKKLFEFAKKAYEMRNEADKITSILSVGQMGVAYSKEGNDVLAQKLLNECVSALDKAGSTISKSYLLNQIALIKSEKDHLEALSTAKKALQLSLSSGSLQEQEAVHQSLSTIYEKMANHKMANYHLKLKTALHDSIIRSQDYQEIAKEEIATTTGTELNQTKQELLVSKNTVAEEKKDKLLWVILLSGLLLLSAWFFYYFQKKAKSKSKLMLDQEIQKFAASELKLLLEKKRISQDLHDEVGSALSSISIMSHSALKNLENHYEKERVQQIGDRAQEAMESIQDIVWVVNPSNEKLESLLTRITKYASETFKAKNVLLKIENNCSHSDLSLSMDQRKNIFLVLKELLNNVAKHSDAKEVSFRCESDQNNLQFILKDDGRAFDPHGNNNRDGNGLINVSQRVTSLDAQFVHSARRGGMNVTELVVVIG
jgi:two-component system sensor histidine kinase UhpB